ncbi:MAG: [FeFe] hydrogenase H-cluster maturation GTPase HydF, partial [Clostridiales bacterium]|nr:[FeFe] hydrogenase H-cluster maturation GTPase HydF [Clostridiales bacterium]
MLNMSDIAVLVVDVNEGFGKEEKELLKKVKEKEIPYIIAFNKCDEKSPVFPSGEEDNCISVSAKDKTNIYELKEKIAEKAAIKKKEIPIVSDLVERGDVAVLVVPIDKAAPKGRLILPQQQTIRELLDCGATAFVTRDSELKETLERLNCKPKIVITDSQVFEKVAKIVPDDVLLTSFSILFARHKGNLSELLKGAAAIKELRDGDKVLISEGCTHHRQCNDIGTVKLPGWIKQFTGKDIAFEFSSGTEFPADLNRFKAVIHCGGCMLSEREMKYRISCAADRNVPITNYGMAIALMNGILERSLEPLRESLDL